MTVPMGFDLRHVARSGQFREVQDGNENPTPCQFAAFTAAHVDDALRAIGSPWTSPGFSLNLSVMSLQTKTGRTKTAAQDHRLD